MLHFIQNTNLFAIAKLLETGLCNMERINVVWKPMTNHFLEVRNVVVYMMCMCVCVCVRVRTCMCGVH